MGYTAEIMAFMSVEHAWAVRKHMKSFDFLGFFDFSCPKLIFQKKEGFFTKVRPPVLGQVLLFLCLLVANTLESFVGYLYAVQKKFIFRTFPNL